MKKIALCLLMLALGFSTARGCVEKHNPGNLVKTSSLWEGQVKNEGRFIAFRDAHHGLRALAIVLLRYERRHNLATVGEVIHRYAPAHENRTEEYAQFVADEIGVGVNETINICAYGTELMRAIILYENGEQPYSDAQIISAFMAGIEYVHENP